MKKHFMRTPSIQGLVFLTIILMVFCFGVSHGEPPEFYEVDLDHVEFSSMDAKLDDLHKKMRLARSHTRWAEAGRHIAETLSGFPDDTYVLDEIVWCSGETQLGNPYFSNPESTIFLELIQELPTASRHYVEAGLLYDRGRILSSKGEYELALAEDPRFIVAHFGMYYCDIALMEDQDRITAHLRILLEDPKEAWRAARLIANSWSKEGFSPEDRQAARQLLEKADLGTALNSRMAQSRAMEFLLESKFSLARTDSVRANFVERFGEFGFVLDDELIPFVCQNLPINGGLAYLEDNLDRLTPDQYHRIKARLLDESGRRMMAESQRASIRWPEPGDLFQQLFLASSIGSSSALDLLTAKVEYSQLDRYSMDLVRLCHERRNQTDKAEKILAELERECPSERYYMRLDELGGNDLAACATLVDSLKANDSRGINYFLYDSFLSEARGDTISLAELGKLSQHRRQQFFLTRMIDGAIEFGDMDRADYLIRKLLKREGLVCSSLEIPFGFACEHKRFELASEILGAMEKRAPGEPYVTNQRFWLLLDKQDYAGALTLINEAADDPDLPPAMGLSMVYAASHLGENLAAEVFLTRMEEADPQGTRIRMARAQFQADKGDHGGAQKILEELMEEYPGDQGIRRLLADISGTVDVFSDLDNDGEAHPMGSLVFDYEDIDWILAAAAQTDTTLDEDAVFLLARESHDLVNTTQAFHRYRFVKQVVTKTACEIHATWNIGFDPGQGVPKVLVARVIDAQGNVAEISRERIFVSSANNAGQDVSEARQLVIPIPNLRPGSVIDVVWESEFHVRLLTGTAHRYGFFNALPRREHRLDIRYNNNLPIKFQVEGTGLVEKRHEEDTATVLSWTQMDGPAAIGFEHAPDVFMRYPWVGYTTYSSWDQIAEEFGEVFWEQVKADDAVTELAKNLTRDCRGRDEKIEALFQYVSGEVNSVAIEVGLGRWIPTSAAEVLERGYGDCKDKTALLLSLLAVLDMDGQAVLVGVSPGPEPHKDFPEFAVFDHALAYIPGWHGGSYCDPTLGAGCARQLPDEVTGMGVLRIDSDGNGRIDRIPLSDPDDNGFEVTLDMWVEAGGSQARIEIETRYHSSFAGKLSIIAGWNDTDAVKEVINDYNGVGLWESCELIDHDVIPDGCGAITLRSVYRDTTWSPANNNAVEFSLETSVAKQYEFSPEENRTLDVAHLEPHRNRAVLRLHHRNGWEPLENNASLEIKNRYFSGSVKYSRQKDGDQVWLQANLVFELKKAGIPLDDYEDFHRDWFALLATQQQAMNFTRMIEPERVEALLSMAASDPRDYDFAIKAAQKILGNDVGGTTRDESAKQRREAALTLLAPALASEEVSAYPLLIAAMIEAKNLKYVRADSLVSIGLEREPGNVKGLRYGLRLKSELSDVEGQLVLLDKLIRLTHSDQYSYKKIAVLYEMNRDAEAELILEKIAMVDGAVDSVTVAVRRFSGYKYSGRFELAEQMIPILRKHFPEETVESFRGGLFMDQRDYLKATKVWEDLWMEDPTNSLVCNNLAWCYAMTSRELEQAETLVRASLAMNGNSSGSLNTLGAVLARQGHWKKARDLFEDLYKSDDRPSSLLVNGGFYGLALYELGKKDQAVELWQSLESVQGRRKWKSVIVRALTMAQDGDKPHGAFFMETEE